MNRLGTLAMAAFTLASGTALAAGNYYVAHKAGSTACTVMTGKPDGKTMMMAGMSSYKTKDAAAAAVF